MRKVYLLIFRDSFAAGDICEVFSSKACAESFCSDYGLSKYKIIENVL